MPDTDTTADPQATTPPGDSGAAQQPDQGQAADTQDESTKTFTQAELDAIVNARVAKAAKAAEKAALDKARKEAERADMDEAKRLAAELQEAREAQEKLQADNRRLLLRSQLAGRVVNLDDAVAVLSDDYVDDDGKVDVDRYLQEKPYLRADTQSKGGNASPGNPPSSRRLTREQIASMTEKEIEERWDEVKSVLESTTT